MMLSWYQHFNMGRFRSTGQLWFQSVLVQYLTHDHVVVPYLWQTTDSQYAASKWPVSTADDSITLNQDCVLSLWWMQSKLVKCQNLTSSLQNATTCTVGDAQGTHLKNERKKKLHQNNMNSFYVCGKYNTKRTNQTILVCNHNQVSLHVSQQTCTVMRTEVHTFHLQATVTITVLQPPPPSH